ncbi:hypothetical protein L596_014827 [Steinernema carpocapsae]|uniref:Uncharacterized protein n=1 Tax=Steinernema carpocapsae TaxID=34508 RepID=A0A4U5NE01_STECR|nr:hypothetical protein L596_014827 [Steinernema carpocapsae]
MDMRKADRKRIRNAAEKRTLKMATGKLRAYFPGLRRLHDWMSKTGNAPKKDVPRLSVSDAGRTPTNSATPVWLRTEWSTMH